MQQKFQRSYESSFINLVSNVLVYSVNKNEQENGQIFDCHLTNEDDWDSEEVRSAEFNDEIFTDTWEIKVAASSLPALACLNKNLKFLSTF